MDETIDINEGADCTYWIPSNADVSVVKQQSLQNPHSSKIIRSATVVHHPFYYWTETEALASIGGSSAVSEAFLQETVTPIGFKCRDSTVCNHTPGLYASCVPTCALICEVEIDEYEIIDDDDDAALNSAGDQQRNLDELFSIIPDTHLVPVSNIFSPVPVARSLPLSRNSTKIPDDADGGTTNSRLTFNGRSKFALRSLQIVATAAYEFQFYGTFDFTLNPYKELLLSDKPSKTKQRHCRVLARCNRFVDPVVDGISPLIDAVKQSSVLPSKRLTNSAFNKNTIRKTDETAKSIDESSNHTASAEDDIIVVTKQVFNTLGNWFDVNQAVSKTNKTDNDDGDDDDDDTVAGAAEDSKTVTPTQSVEEANRQLLEYLPYHRPGSDVEPLPYMVPDTLSREAISINTRFKLGWLVRSLQASPNKLDEAPFASTCRAPRTMASQHVPFKTPQSERPAAPLDAARLQAFKYTYPHVDKCIRQLFQERPLWQRNSFKSRLKQELLQSGAAQQSVPSDFALHDIVVNYGFMFRDGPWGRCWCRYGYVPEQHPRESKALQMARLRLRESEDTDSRIDQYLGRSRINYYRHRGMLPKQKPARTTRRRTTHFPTTITAPPEFTTESVNIESEMADANVVVKREEEEIVDIADVPAKEEPHISTTSTLAAGVCFRTGILPTLRCAEYQLIDVHVPEVQQILHENDGSEPEKCSEKDGFLRPGAMDRIVSVMKKCVSLTLDQLEGKALMSTAATPTDVPEERSSALATNIEQLLALSDDADGATVREPPD